MYAEYNARSMMLYLHSKPGFPKRNKNTECLSRVEKKPSYISSASNLTNAPHSLRNTL